jgi:hypothetical protein
MLLKVKAIKNKIKFRRVIGHCRACKFFNHYEIICTSKLRKTCDCIKTEISGIYGYIPEC